MSNFSPKKYDRFLKALIRVIFVNVKSSQSKCMDFIYHIYLLLKNKSLIIIMCFFYVFEFSSHFGREQKLF